MAKTKYTWLKDYTPPLYRQKAVSLEFFLDYEKTILKSDIIFAPNYDKPIDLVLQGGEYSIELPENRRQRR